MQRMLQAQSGLALLRWFLFAAFALVAGGIRHGMGFVEDDDAIKAASKPVDDLLHAARLVALGLRAQGRVGGKEDSFVERDRRTLAEARQGHDVGAVAADRGPIAFGVLDQFVGFGNPDRAFAALKPIVENDGGDLAALAGAGAVAEKPAAPKTHGIRGIGRCGRHEVVGFVDGVRPGEMSDMRFAGIDHALELRIRQNAGCGQPGRQMRPVRGAGRSDRGHGG